MRGLLAVFVGFFLLLLTCLPVNVEAIMIALSTEQLTSKAENIVIARASKVEHKWTADKSTIYTEVELDVNKTIKGENVPDKIVVTYLGGVVGDIGLRVSDTPTIKKDERVLLFLKENVKKSNLREVPNTVFRVVGSAQGKYSIDANNMARKRGFALIDDSAAIDNDIALDELVQKINDTMKNNSQ